MSRRYTAWLLLTALALASARADDLRLPAGTGPSGAAADSALVPVGASPWRGASPAKVTLVVFSDFQCPFCARLAPTLEALERANPGTLRIVFKHNPLPFHRDAFLAAEASLAAAAQGKFWDFHDKLMANQRHLQRTDLERYAQELGLDLHSFRRDLDARVHRTAVDEDMALARRLGARGTPTSILNGRVLVGARPASAFQAVIDEEVREADQRLAEGVAPEHLYAEITRGRKIALPPASSGRAHRPLAPSKRVHAVPVSDRDSCKGPQDALVTLVGFLGFQCPYSWRSTATVDSLLRDYAGKLRFCVKHHPLPFHRHGRDAATAALEAQAQGKFWAYHDLLFQNQRALERSDLLDYARRAGLDAARVASAIDADLHAARLAEDEALTKRVGVRGTPTFFVNGRRLVGARPADAFKPLIDEELKKALALVKSGVPAARVYERVTAPSTP
jgi:protein-disulfide isomerase